jgi:hypothetical protein
METYTHNVRVSYIGIGHRLDSAATPHTVAVIGVFYHLLAETD